MTKLDKTFSTMNSPICIEGPKMVEVSHNPNIEIISFVNVLKVEGFIGNFKVRIGKIPRYVFAENCTGCEECVDVCPVEYWGILFFLAKGPGGPCQRSGIQIRGSEKHFRINDLTRR